MSSCENYSEDDFEDDFEDLTEAGTPATLGELQEIADDITFLGLSVATKDKEDSRIENKDHHDDEETSVQVLNQPHDVTEEEPMSRQKRWSEICKVSDYATTTTTKNNIDGAKLVVPRPVRKIKKTDKSLAVKQQREKKANKNRDRHKQITDGMGEVEYCNSTNTSNNRTKEDSSREKTLEARHQKKQNQIISKLAEKRQKEKKKNRIRKRNRLYHPASYGNNIKNQNESLSLKNFLAMKPSPSLPTFKYSQSQSHNNTPVSYVSSLPNPIREKTQPCPSIMCAIPKAIWKIHAKLNEKDLHLKAKERALHACENALIARENAITIRENAIEQKILKFGLHEYDPINFNENRHGEREDKQIRINLLPSFAANTRCPRNNEYDEESATNSLYKNNDRNSCCTIKNKVENNGSSYCCKRNIEVDSENITDPESMSSQLLHLFKLAGAETKYKPKATTSTNHTHDDMNPATARTKDDKNNKDFLERLQDADHNNCRNKETDDDDGNNFTIVNEHFNNSNNFDKNFLPKLNQKNQYNNLKKQKRDVIRKEKLRVKIRNNKGKNYSGLYSVGRPSLSNFI